MTNQLSRSHTIACIAYELSRYIPLFDELEQEQVLGKIIRLYTPGDHDAEKPSISLPRLQLDDLFVTEQVPRTSHSDSPIVVGLNGSVDAHSPRTIDPTLVCKRMNLQRHSDIHHGIICCSQPLHKREECCNFI